MFWGIYEAGSASCLFSVSVILILILFWLFDTFIILHQFWDLFIQNLSYFQSWIHDKYLLDYRQSIFLIFPHFQTMLIIGIFKFLSTALIEEDFHNLI